jgi:tRNA uridine 5-carboxymethylaminomethyl modification enzyme
LLKEASLAELLRRPEVDIQHLLSFVEDGDSIDDAVVEQVEIQSKYEGYLARQQTDIDKALRYDSLKLPADFNYTEVSGLSNELVEKLQRQRPETLGQASRMQGMTPAAVSLLLVYLKKKTA